jgi:hypothetical protein
LGSGRWREVRIRAGSGTDGRNGPRFHALFARREYGEAIQHRDPRPAMRQRARDGSLVHLHGDAQLNIGILECRGDQLTGRQVPRRGNDGFVRKVGRRQRVADAKRMSTGKDAA